MLECDRMPVARGLFRAVTGYSMNKEESMPAPFPSATVIVAGGGGHLPCFEKHLPLKNHSFPDVFTALGNCQGSTVYTICQDGSGRDK